MVTRNDIITAVFGQSTLPADLPSETFNVTGPLDNLAAVDSVDMLTMDMGGGEINYSYRYNPTATPVSKLMIVHQGHDGYGNNGTFDAVQEYIKLGWTVVLISKPGKDGNGGSPSQSYNDVTDLRYFWQPAISVVNLHEQTHAEIVIQGISGGGDTATCVGAIDPRIDTTISTAGWLPTVLRTDAPGTKWEQIVIGQTWGYENMAWLAALEYDRQHIVINNRLDPCCFNHNGENGGAGAYTDVFPMQMRALENCLNALGGGVLKWYEDATHQEHKISKTFNIFQTQFPALGLTPPIPHEDNIKVAPGADSRFSQTGDWFYRGAVAPSEPQWQTGNSAGPNYDGESRYAYDNLGLGVYKIYTTWTHHANRAMSVPFEIWDGAPGTGTLKHSGTFQQKNKPPQGDWLEPITSRKFQQHGPGIQCTTGTLTLVLKQVGNTNSDQYVIAGDSHLEEV